MYQEKQQNKDMKITGKTNGWIASRDYRFDGKTEITIATGLSLKEAQTKLLEMFNELYEDEDGYEYAETWEDADKNDRRGKVRLSVRDGLHSFEYDSRIFEIENENE